MKNCPFCAEEIQDAAIKCKHCGEFLSGSHERSLSEEKPLWYFRTGFIVIALLSVGPMALPLIWWRPNTSRQWKVGLTVAILALSWVFYLATMESLKALEEYYLLLESL